MNKNFKPQHLLISLFFFALLVNTSCSNEDDNTNENEDSDIITEDINDTSNENENIDTEIEIAANCSSTLGANYIAFEAEATDFPLGEWKLIKKVMKTI